MIVPRMVGKGEISHKERSKAKEPTNSRKGRSGHQSHQKRPCHGQGIFSSFFHNQELIGFITTNLHINSIIFLESLRMGQDECNFISEFVLII